MAVLLQRDEPRAKTGINWDARTARIRQGKTGELIKSFDRPARGRWRSFASSITIKTDLVFSRSGNVTAKFYRILRAACIRAGVPYGRGMPNGRVFHDARHSTTTHLLESNVSPKTVQEWMGWSDDVFGLYTRTPRINPANRLADHSQS